MRNRSNLRTVTGKRCNRCGGLVAWLVSKRTGKPYLVNVLGRDGEDEVASPFDFHRCDPAMVAAYQPTVEVAQ